MRFFLPISLLGSLLVFVPACSSDPADPSGAGASGGSGGAGGAGGGGGGGGGGGEPAGCSEPNEVPCEDQVIQGMNLQNDIAPGLITNEPDGSGFRTGVDATAGGAFVSDPDSYVYGKFTETGLQKVEISDEDSIASMDWDIAFRRYVVRINSGNSGPSCVTATRTKVDTKYEEVSAAPDLPFRKDEYFSEACELIPDGSGLPGSPATALSGFWTYTSCVKMTGTVYAIRLADGRAVKLIVDTWYEPSVQEQCNTTDSIPMMNTGSANYRIRWAFLP
ncbi:HmuY family protein [Polyangium mundeleinium]|uniref:HmuY family protein n=1 Tax=Polyangium mundeleinium TaxID=2995306 RepID=A0ABT5EUM4_9BACT|nr:HmuY family protein [Polyangium mundeleinium]MDC0744888.1 HmuY family protein [Polyangium mundeleinium]